MDPKTVGIYTASEVARFTGLPRQTVVNWAYGYRRASGSHAEPLTHPDEATRRLSFMNLVEVYMLRAFRRYGVRPERVRRAVAYLRTKLDQRWPLATNRFLTDGIGVILEDKGNFLDLSQNSQVLLREYVQVLGKRVDWESSRGKRPARLYPHRHLNEDAEHVVCIDPLVRHGYPAVRGVPTSVILERSEAGESIDALSADYELPAHLIEEALRWEKTAA